MAMNALVDFIGAIKGAQLSGTSEEVLNRARDYHRKASFLIDYVEAENSTGFHAPQEAARIFFLAMDHLRHGQATLAEDPVSSGLVTESAPEAPVAEAPAAEAPVAL
jgi:nitrite reductase (cytochrome c-552)